VFPIGDTIPRRNPPIASWLVILANGLVFLCELPVPEQELDPFLYLFGVVLARYSRPGWALQVGFPKDD
jgi:hypothetical protein